MRKRSPVLVLPAALLLLIASALALSAQSNELINALLDEAEADFGKAVYLALTAGALIPEDASVEEALAELNARQWNIGEKTAEDPMNLGEYAYLLMRIFDVQGGLMYRLFPGPRYAARELAFREIVRGDPSPGRALSGEEAMRILGALMEWVEVES